jgi:hypothetical protein
MLLMDQNQQAKKLSGFVLVLFSQNFHLNNYVYSGFEAFVLCILCEHYPMERVNNDSTYYDYIDQIPKDQKNEG